VGLQRLAARDTLAGNPPVEVVVPKSGVLAGVYVQAISAYAPQPNAAKLWMEYLYSDEGQLGWLKGYCHPARFNAMAAAGKIPADLLDALPPAESYEAAYFPTLEEVDANKAAVTGGWDATSSAPTSSNRALTPAPVTSGAGISIQRADRAARIATGTLGGPWHLTRTGGRHAALPVEWLGILPFALFALLFLILPTMKIVVGAFRRRAAVHLSEPDRPEHAFDPVGLLDLDQAERSDHRCTGLR
jgi:hypothetical protein